MKITDIFKRVSSQIRQAVTKTIESTTTVIKERATRRREKRKTSKEAVKPDTTIDEKPKQPETPITDQREKITITKREAYRRMGIRDDLSYNVNGKKITMGMVDKYFRQNGIDITRYMLGDTKDYKYDKKTWKKQQEKFASKIENLYKIADKKGLDPDMLDALNAFVLGEDIVFDYNQIF